LLLDGCTRIIGRKENESQKEAVRKAEPKMPGLLIGISGTILEFSLAFGGWRVSKTEYWLYWNYFVACFTVVYILFIVLYNKRLANYLANRVFAPFFQKLSDSGDFRKNALKLGAILFIPSFFFKILLNLLS